MKKARHHPVFLSVVDSLLPLLQRSKALTAMPFDDLCDHLAYFWNHGTISYIIGQDERPRAVCLIKLFRNLGQFMDAYVHEPGGEFCMIECMIADDPLAMGQIFEEFTQRWGPYRTILWDREERTEIGSPRIYKWRQFEKLARRLTYGVIENV